MSTPNHRYFPNDSKTLRRIEDPRALLTQSLERIVTNCPPADENRHGFFAGPTSIAYLFFHLNRTHPDLQIHGKSMKQWLDAYLALPEPKPHPDIPLLSRCGIMNEHLCWTALRAIVYQEQNVIEHLLDLAGRIIEEGDPKLNELILGGPGALVVLRTARQFIPKYAERLDTAMQHIIITLLQRRPWTLKGKRYYGAAHGDIGIVSQIVLSDPSRAEELESDLQLLIDLQLEDGNWLNSEGGHADMVQWCHGAPGFIVALDAIQQYFPHLDLKIKEAIRKGRRCVWEQGLLVKEPNLCHGITGNAMALEGEQKEHFLSFTTPESFHNNVWDPSMDPWSLFKGEAGRAWVWAQLDGGSMGFPVFTEV